MIKVFISYSHDSQAHRDFVRGLANQLCIDGIDCLVDQYINGSPSEGWQRWMENEVEAADFVLIVCTEIYLRRYRGQETGGSGKGVTFEGVVISQTLYNAYYRNTKFVPILPAGGDSAHVPLPLQLYTSYMLPEQYDYLYRYLTKQPKYVRPKVGSQKVMPPIQEAVPTSPPIPSPSPTRGCRKRSVFLVEDPLEPAFLLGSKTPKGAFATPSTREGREQGLALPPPNKIQITKLPHTNSHLFGRETELTMLDNAWANGVNVLILKAMGGTGKTSLLKHWLDQFVADGYRSAQAVFTWSFYSQGSAENKQVSTDDFFESALRFFGYTDEVLPVPYERSIQLAHLVAAKRALLILDGLESLQHPVGIFHGELKDQSLKVFLQQLAASNAGLCLISSRQTVEELNGKPETLVLAHDLEQLQVKDGIELLRYIGVSGSESELTKAVKEVAGHALALNLLGSYVKTVLGGDIRQRDKIPGLMAERNDGRHAKKMLAAYETHLQGTTALNVLYLLGLFDRPVSPGAIQCLRQANIPKLTDALDNLSDWYYAIDDLREQNLLNAVNPDYPDNLSCHPLIREYFGKQLEVQYPTAWQKAHTRLYEYYKDLSEKELPDMLEEMQPLFSAVTHGCAAGMHQQALDEVYWPRIQRSEGYLCNILGAFSDDLATIAHFFSRPWQTPTTNLDDADKTVILSWASFDLRALGRLREAVEPMQAGIDDYDEQENWEYAAVSATNLSELHLALGDIIKAVRSAAQGVTYADRSGDKFERMASRATYADALHQAGQLDLSSELFQVAEALQQEHQPNSCLYSLPGFQYCDFLLAQGSNDDSQIMIVLERYEQWVEWQTQSDSLLDRSLEYLIAGRVYLQLALNNPSIPLSEAKEWLKRAVAGLRASGYQDMLPLGLLARASLFRHTHNLIRARQDLQEVFDIANSSGMRLHLTDYHLEMARLLLVEGTLENLQHHITEAARLITETGYHRRDQELLDLQLALTENT